MCKVSLIIPTYNSAGTLKACLKSIFDQTYSKIEVIVVDNHSSDDTVLIARRLGIPPWIKKCGRSAARNFGASVSKGDLLMFIDSDMLLSPTVVEECAEFYLKDNKACYIIPEISTGHGYWASCKALGKRVVLACPGAEAARAFPKQVFKAVGGFNEVLEAGEDFDLHFRAEDNRYPIRRIRSHIIHYEGCPSLKYILTKTIYYRRCMRSYKSDKNKQTPFLKMCIHRSRIILSDPVHAVGFLLLSLAQKILMTL